MYSERRVDMGFLGSLRDCGQRVGRVCDAASDNRNVHDASHPLARQEASESGPNDISCDIGVVNNARCQSSDQRDCALSVRPGRLR